jgi:predicted AAA+ superfamily ATPase
MSNLTSSELLQNCLSLLIYQSVWQFPAGTTFINLLTSLDQKSSTVLENYGEWFRAIATTNLSWQDYIIRQILLDRNPFSHQVQTTPLQQLSLSLVAAVKHDLEILQAIANVNPQQLTQWVQTSSNNLSLVDWQQSDQHNTFLHQHSNWQNAINQLAIHYQKHGVGIFAEYWAFRWQQDHLIGITHPDPIQLDEIIGYEAQKQTLVKNTEFLIAGHTALNVLLYGSRGSGKSSLVKALLQTYAKSGLRLVEVDKTQLKHLPLILEQLRPQSQKFIIFVDDLSFEEDDEAFKALKVVLEGSATAKASNVVVYATSNRRHLVREFFDERPTPSQAEEIHAWDSMQEKLSFGDRFGITLTFSPANQTKYLAMVEHLAQKTGINLPQAELQFRAKQWATQHNGRSGRSAKQFIDFLSSEIATDQNL